MLEICCNRDLNFLLVFCPYLPLFQIISNFFASKLIPSISIKSINAVAYALSVCKPSLDKL